MSSAPRCMSSAPGHTPALPRCLCPPKRLDYSGVTRDLILIRYDKTEQSGCTLHCISRERKRAERDHIESRVRTDRSKRLGGQREGRRCTERRQVRGSAPVGPHGGRTATRVRGAFSSKSMKLALQTRVAVRPPYGPTGSDPRTWRRSVHLLPSLCPPKRLDHSDVTRDLM